MELGCQQGFSRAGVQMIIENTINNNSISRSLPLRILVSAGNDNLEISHTIQPKMNSPEEDEAFENIRRKFNVADDR